MWEQLLDAGLSRRYELIVAEMLAHHCLFIRRLSEKVHNFSAELNLSTMTPGCWSLFTTDNFELLDTVHRTLHAGRFDQDDLIDKSTWVLEISAISYRASMV